MKLYRYAGTSTEHTGKVYVRVSPSDPSKIPARQEFLVVREACWVMGAKSAHFHVFGESEHHQINFNLDDMRELSEYESSVLVVLST